MKNRLSDYYFATAFSSYVIYLIFCHLVFFSDLQFPEAVSNTFGSPLIVLFYLLGLLLNISFLLKRKNLKVISWLLVWLVLSTQVNPRMLWVSFPNLPLSLLCYLLIVLSEKNILPKKYEEYFEFLFRLTLGISYFTSGLDKLNTAQWSSGSAVATLYQTHHITFRSNSIVPIILGFTWIPVILTYATIAIETSGLFLFFKRTKLYALVALTSLHLGISFLMLLFELSMPYFIVLVWLILRDLEQRKYIGVKD